MILKLRNCKLLRWNPGGGYAVILADLRSETERKQARSTTRVEYHVIRHWVPTMVDTVRSTLGILADGGLKWVITFSLGTWQVLLDVGKCTQRVCSTRTVIGSGFRQRSMTDLVLHLYSCIDHCYMLK